ncbi:MAG: DUF2092 domain-containing protein [Planctomycetota bacterium]
MWTVVALLAAGAAWAACGSPTSQTGKPGAAAGRAEAGPADPPRIDPRAAKALRRMSDTLGGSGAFRFSVEAHWDDVLPSGLKLRRSGGLSYTIQRPQGLRVEFTGANDDRLLVYDGSSTTLYDRTHKFYAIRSAPGSVEETLDMLAKEADLQVPLAGFLFSNPYKALLEKVTSATLVGPGTVGGVDAEHIVLSQAGLDWQLWVAKGEPALPLRIVLTYLRVDGTPQYTATLTDWDVAAATKPTDFKVQIPGDAEQIEFTIDRGES